ncbi:MAG TPA: zinc ribbon domain-containing protein [Gaiellaceae bacterium]|nr:zinc ribbon domain-containing protein [Gaiellaceae bacterium]
MPRFPLPGRSRRRRGQTDGPGASQEPRIVRRAPSPGALRRERRAILKAREELLRDLGGLAMEMYRREQFREDLLAEHARDIANLEVRLHELDSMLAAAAAGRRATTSRCECGAPVIWGSHFCANCGRPVGEDAVVSCPDCGHPLPADAEFCPSCGRAAEIGKEDRATAEPEPEREPEPESAANGDREPEATVIRSGATGEEAPKPDRWEE